MKPSPSSSFKFTTFQLSTSTFPTYLTFGNKQQNYSCDYFSIFSEFKENSSIKIFQQSQRNDHRKQTGQVLAGEKFCNCVFGLSYGAEQSRAEQLSFQQTLLSAFTKGSHVNVKSQV